MRGAGTLWQVRLILSGGDSALVGSGSLGAGALLAALLGAPFVIWGTVLRHQTLRYQKEGHITERITAAVEQLGAEKTVKRTGRNIVVRTIHPEGYEEREQLFIFKNEHFSITDGERWSRFFDQIAAKLRWIRVSYQADIIRRKTMARAVLRFTQPLVLRARSRPATNALSCLMSASTLAYLKPAWAGPDTQSS